MIKYSLQRLETDLKEKQAGILYKNEKLIVKSGKEKVEFTIIGEGSGRRSKKGEMLLPLDWLVHDTDKVAALIISKLRLNKTIFARLCEVKRIDKRRAGDFLNRFHLMGATSSAFNLGLFYKQELVAVASFSKGRKMDRLPENERSFELIRFCTGKGITVSGGLSRLVKTFYREKKAGDIMTYVDKQFSNGKAFLQAGFKMLEETEPNFFLVDRMTWERIPVKNTESDFDKKRYYLSCNAGNLKMIFRL